MIDYADTVLLDWTKNLWILNRSAGGDTKAAEVSFRQEWDKRLEPQTTRGLSRTELFSERSFMRLAWGVATIEAIGNRIIPGRRVSKAFDAVMRHGPVESWRQSILRNADRWRHQFLEDALQESLQKFSEKEIKAQYPAGWSAQEVLKRLDSVKYPLNSVTARLLQEIAAEQAKPGTGPEPKL